MKSLIILCLVLALSHQSTTALYEDQAGTFDWHRQHIGTVTSATFHRSKPRVYVSTKENVLAALHLRDGSIVWRRALGEEDALDAATFVQNQGLFVSLSSGGRILRAWEPTDGALAWERITYTSADADQSPAGLWLLSSQGTDATVAVLAGGAFQLYDVSDGQSLWSSKASIPAATNVHLVQQSTRLLLYTYNTGATTANLVVLDGASGAVLEQQQLPSPKPLGQAAAVSGGILAILTTKSTSICLPQQTDITCTPLSTLAPQLPTGSPLTILPTTNGFTLASSSAATGVALLVTVPGALHLAEYYPAASVASAGVPLQTQEDAVALVEPVAAGGLTIVVVDSASGEEVHREAVGPLPLAPAKGTAPYPAAAFLGTYRRKEGKDGLRLLLRRSDAALVLVQQSQAVWARQHEALASVSAVLFADLPADAAAAAAAAPSLSDRLQLQLLSLKAQLSFTTPEEAEELARLKKLLSTRSRPTRDANGLRKLLLTLTGTGSLLGLHTGGGDVLWSAHWGPSGAPDRLLQWRTFHDVSHAPEVLLLRTGAQPKAWVVNAHTGERVATLDLPGPVAKIVQIAPTLHDGTTEQHLYLAVPPAGGPPALLPDTLAARAHLSSLPASLHYWLLDAPSSTLAGYTLQPPPAAPAAPLSASETWRLALPEPILALAARDPSEPIHSLSKILGDRSFLIKYLNPNTLFLATGLAPGAAPPAAPGSPPADPKVTAYLLDTATGRILFRQVHSGGRGPVHAVLSENWVVYQYFSTVSSRLEMAVMEAYDDTPRSFSAMDLVAGRVGNITQASDAPPPLRVLSQAYYSHIPLKGLAATRTARGISSKQVLLATASNQLYAMDKRFLDPRRPLTARPSKEDQEEGLVPYLDTLPVFPNSYPTYDKQVAALRGVVCAPAALESSTHVVAYGVDLFYTRLQPSGGFDTLPDDFSYALLVVAIMGLVSGAVVLWLAGKRTELKSKWA